MDKAEFGETLRESWTDYELVVQNYPSVIPKAGDFRYEESFWRRQNLGGCGFRDADADFANDTVIPKINKAVADAVTIANRDTDHNPVHLLDVTHAFDGHRLCETGVNLIEGTNHASWTSLGAADPTSGSTRSVSPPRPLSRPTNSRRASTPTTGGSSPCATASDKSGTAATCTAASAPAALGANTLGEPNMSLQPS